MPNERGSATIASNARRRRNIAWMLVLLVLALGLIATSGGCTETPVDGSTADTTLRVRTNDTTILSEQRRSRDTIIESDRLVVVDTVVREIIVRDTVRLTDTVVVRRHHARAQVREATVILWNTLAGKLDTVLIAFEPTLLEVVQKSPEWRLKFEATLNLARSLSEAQFGRHGFSSLTIHVPDAPFRPGSLVFKDNPDFGMGAKLLWNDRVLRTGSDPPHNRNYGNFEVHDINERQRTFRVDYVGGFFTSSQSPPIFIRVLFSMTY